MHKSAWSESVSLRRDPWVIRCRKDEVKSVQVRSNQVPEVLHIWRAVAQDQGTAPDYKVKSKKKSAN